MVVPLIALMANEEGARIFTDDATMSTAITALSGEYLDTRTFRYARTQRDAGIEYQQWEDRLKPLRPLSIDIAIGAAAIAAGVAAVLFV